MKNKKRYYCSLITALILLTCSLVCGLNRLNSKTVHTANASEQPILLPSDQTNTQDKPDPVYRPQQELSNVFQEYDITLMAVGDNLLHMGIVNTGKQSDGSRNYDFLFDGIRRFLGQADLKIINQETILGGNQLGFHGYPLFNSPSEVSDAIANAGFNVVLQATNHTSDQGLNGIEHCLALWKMHPEVLVAGLHAPYVSNSEVNSELNSQASSQSRIPFIEINGCTFAVLNYTYGPNSASVSSAVAERLDLLCAVDEATRKIDFTTLNPQVLSDIVQARQMADVVIVCPHWGTEYATAPSSVQKQFAMQMTEAGADVIIGTHPHVVQPVTWIEADNGNRALCYYSLGNYVSTQQNPKSMLEGMAWVTFHVTENGVAVSDDNTGIIPLVCHYTSGPVRLKNVYLLEEYTEKLAQSHGIIPYGGVSFHLSSLQKWSSEILGDWVLSADQILSQPTPQYCGRPE